MIYKLKMGSDTICYIKSDLKNKFSYFKFEKDTVFQRNKADKNNIATITVDKSSVKMEMTYAEKDARMYGIKKEWTQNNIG